MTLRPNSKHLIFSVLLACCIAPWFGSVSTLAQAQSTAAQSVAAPNQTRQDLFRGAMLAATQVNAAKLGELKAAGFDAIALPIHDAAGARNAERAASELIRQAGMSLYFWIEVARCPELADANPTWMASLQGHSEWRRRFQDPPVPGDGEVVKTYPWVPILNKEPFEGQLARIKVLLEDRPKPHGIFLNDIQGSPSACGCGNHLCRWTSDYGKLRTTTPLGNQAPSDFVAAVKAFVPQVEVVPVWTTECEEHDGAHDGLCAGVGCFKGICWKAYTAQLAPLAQACPTVGVLLSYRAFQRDLPTYGEKAGWIEHAVKSFAVMPVRNQSQPIPPTRLLTVLQGWDVTEQEISQQIEVAKSSGVNRYLVAYAKIEQDWRPRIVKVE